MSDVQAPSKTSSIQRCTCQHAYQDKRYGKGKRVHTIQTKSTSANRKCTVCGAIR